MSKKAKTFFNCILIILIISIAIIFMQKNDVFTVSKNSLWEQKSSQTKSNLRSSLKNGDKKVAEMTDIVTTDGFKYKIANVKKTKKRGTLPIIEGTNRVKIDKNGTITNEYSYLIIKLEMENLSNQKKEMYLNSNYIDIFNKDNKKTESAELYLFDKNLEHINRKDYFCYVFKPNEKAVFILGYIISDDSLQDKNVRFKINNSGVVMRNGEDYDNVRYIKLNWEESGISEKSTKN